MRDWLRSRWVPPLLFVVGLLIFGLTSWDRLGQQSKSSHFVYQADAWLDGRLHIERVPQGDDQAIVRTVRLQDGSTTRGRWIRDNTAFRTTKGVLLSKSVVKRTEKQTYYNSFPAFPAVLLVPQVAVAGTEANDVIFTVVIAAFILPLMFLVLRRFAAFELSKREPVDDLWLSFGMTFGTVLYFSAVQGNVWYTAHVVAALLCLCYVWCSIGAKHPILAGLCLGCATLTRTPMALMFPFFAFEAWRMSGGRDGVRQFLVTGAKFAAPIAVIATIGMVHNYLRFDELTEFGHSYLSVRQQKQIEAHGMFDLHYLGRNLAAAFTLLPDFHLKSPYVVINGHGLAMWFTTPLLFYVLWPREKGPAHRALWITVALVAAPTLLYQNSGWLQFGYRFSLDYMVFLVLLIAVGGRKLGWFARSLIIVGVAINLFGAMTFPKQKYYKYDYCGVVLHADHCQARELR